MNMIDSKQKLLVLTEYFPIKAGKLADSISKTIPELRHLIIEGVYYIDDNCEIIENPVNKAFYDLGLALKKHLPTTQKVQCRLRTVFKKRSTEINNKKIIAALERLRKTKGEGFNNSCILALNKEAKRLREAEE